MHNDEHSKLHQCLQAHPRVEKKTHVGVAAVAHAEAVPAFHSPGRASAGNMNLKAKNKGSSTMVIPVRRRLRNKTPPAAAQRVPSMGVV